MAAYKPSKPIEYNIKVMKEMINRAKVATNTIRSATDFDTNNRQEQTHAKFFKK